MNYGATILNSLLDRYERSAHFFGAARTNRRIAFNFNRETMPEYFSGEQPLIKAAIHQAAVELQAEGLVRLEWLRGEKGNLLKRVVLNLEELPGAYRFVGRTPRFEQLAALQALIKQKASQTNLPWIKKFLSCCETELAERRLMPSLLPPEKSDQQLLLKALAGLEQKGETEMPERVFSLRYLGGSKLLSGRVRGSLAAAAREYLLQDAELPEEDVLAELGIVKTSNELLLAGPLSLRIRCLDVRLSPLVFGAVVDTQMNKETKITEVSTDRIILIENKTNFHELARRGLAETMLLIYLGGFPGPGKRRFLADLHHFCVRERPSARFFHWGDIDWGGFKIHRLLKEHAFPGLIPLFMDGETLLKYQEAGEQLTAAYRTKLEKMKKDPAYTGFTALIDLMLELNIRLEQEALLADGALPLAEKIDNIT
ncbi:MAG: hypothetical protein DDT21_01445 [Syntrophomonadaceae bacterium]|nr:hypothetical protein [Bacillota bacterium]